MNTLDYAKMYAERGIPVFPLKGKVPCFEGWSDKASTDIDTIEKWSKDYPNCNFAVDGTHSGLCIIDLDNKDGKVGSENFRTMLKQIDCKLPETLVVATPTGGYHYYYTGQTGNKVNLIVENVVKETGIDIRSTGGYVVTPGSIHPDTHTEYTIANDAPIADLPEKLQNYIGQAAVRADNAEEFLVEPDQPVNIMEALEYLNHKAPIVQQHEGWDMNAYAVACGVRDFGLSEELCYDILQSSGWAEKCGGHLQRLRIKVTNAYQLANSPAGNATTEVALQELTEQFDKSPLVSTKTPIPYKPVGNINLKKLAKRRWVLGSRLIRQYISCIVAPGGVGKSTISFLDALAIAANTSILGDDILDPTGKVWIYNAEDPQEELDLRFAAVAQHYNINLKEIGDKVIVTSGREFRIRLVSKDTKGNVMVDYDMIENLIRFIKKMNISVVFMDPLVRLHDCSENDNTAMDRVAEMLTQIAERANCSVCIVHHSRKMNNTSGAGEADSARGASALIDAARLCHTFTVMTDKEAEQFGISDDERRWFVRMDDAKLNLAPPTDRIRWFKRVSILLPNGESCGSFEKVELQRVEKTKQLDVAKREQVIALASMAILLVKKEMSISELVRDLSEQQEIVDLNCGDTTLRSTVRGYETCPFIYDGYTIRASKLKNGKVRVNLFEEEEDL